MDTINFPEGYNQVMPYLIVDDAAGFQKFMENVFGATEKMKVVRDDGTVMHGEIAVGASVFMFAGCTKEFTPTPGAFFIYVNDADKTFNDAITNGASEIQPMSDQDYGRTGGVKDANGNTWWITSVKK